MRRHKLVILAIVALVASIVCLATSDSAASIVDTSSADDAVTTNPGKATNSSASATITISWRIAPSEGD